MTSTAPEYTEFDDFAENFSKRDAPDPKTRQLLTAYGDLRRRVRQSGTQARDVYNPEVVEYLTLTCRWTRWILDKDIRFTARDLVFVHHHQESNCIWFELIRRAHDAAAAYLSSVTEEEQKGDLSPKRRQQLFMEARYLVGVLRYIQTVAFVKWRGVIQHQAPYNLDYNRTLTNWCRAYALYTVGMITPDDAPKKADTLFPSLDTEREKFQEREKKEERIAVAEERVLALYTARTILSHEDMCLSLCRPGKRYPDSGSSITHKCKVSLETRDESAVVPDDRLYWCQRLHTEFLLAAAEYFDLFTLKGKAVACLRLARHHGREVPDLEHAEEDNQRIFRCPVPDPLALLRETQEQWTLPEADRIQNGDDPLVYPVDHRQFYSQ